MGNILTLRTRPWSSTCMKPEAQHEDCKLLFPACTIPLLNVFCGSLLRFQGHAFSQYCFYYMFFYNILICQSVPQLWLLGSHCHVYLPHELWKLFSLGALTKCVSVAAPQSKAFSLPQSSAALKSKTKTKKEVTQSVSVPNETEVVGICQYSRYPVGLLTSIQY